jgi:hypothetical protein
LLDVQRRLHLAIKWPPVDVAQRAEKSNAADLSPVIRRPDRAIVATALARRRGDQSLLNGDAAVSHGALHRTE